MLLFFVSISILFFLHVVIWHFKILANRGVSMIILLALISWPLGIGVRLLSGYGVTGQDMMLSLSIYMMIVMLYLHWYVGIDRSVSVRILGELVDAPQGRLSLKKLEEIYPRKQMFKHRMDLMVKTGWLYEQQGRYSCTDKGRSLARAAGMFKRIYGLTQTG